MQCLICTVKEQIEGFQTNTSVQYVFIDEAQDYSPFQFAFIRRLFLRSKMTVLGNLKPCNIYPCGCQCRICGVVLRI
ncbi:UvrD-helicase domain-containing protein [Aneurinibacillus thermoaerophilus]|uniref:UvrD-helicase domain-containing protein n=1 Tax=Aneurinibacillus TaxID=55079 RepID=UPI002E1A7646|nr:UvrD-helicase domain-containing protein [Aneurinibacillus thermoaerophilus]